MSYVSANINKIPQKLNTSITIAFARSFFQNFSHAVSISSYGKGTRTVGHIADNVGPWDVLNFL